MLNRSVKMKRVENGETRWTDGFWQARFELCRNTILPRMKEALQNPDNGACLTNFEVGAGKRFGSHQGLNWSDGDCYKWLEALAHVYAVTRDEALNQEMDKWISLIADTQAEDGYIGTQTQLNSDKKRWSQRHLHELYNMGHLMTAATVHQRATGKTTLMAAACKAADYLYDLFSPRPPELGHFGWNPSHIMGLVELFRATGNQKYLELAGIFIDMRGSKPWPTFYEGGVDANDPFPGDQSQDRVALREETEAVGHAVTATYLWAGAADVVKETGEQELFDALQRLWDDVTQKKMYITGAIGALHQGASLRHDMVQEAFGKPYELPNATAYNETCANIGNAMWNRRMFELTSSGKYMDVAERVLFNSALSGMDVDGTRFCYCNPLARNHGGAPLLHNDTPERWVVHGCYCCPPQIARTLASVHEWAYNISEGTLWCNLYGTSIFEGTIPDAGELSLRQETDYPWNGDIDFKIESAVDKEISLRFRIPEWTAADATLLLNDTVLDIQLIPGKYIEVKRVWKAGDELMLKLPMPVRQMVGHPEVEEIRNHVAITRGPLVYCLEGTDLPSDVPIHEVHIPANIEWTSRYDKNLLGGLTVLEGEARCVQETSWKDRLYAERSEHVAEPLHIQLIPCYAWQNRGRHNMRVWLPSI